MTDQHVHHKAARTRGQLYLTLADALSYPTDELKAGLLSGEFDRHIGKLTAELPYVMQWPVCDELDLGALGSEYLRLFELPSEQQPCALYGGVHAGDRGSVMQELLRYYRHFGLSVDGAADRDLPDSLATVLEFMQFLCVKESVLGEDVNGVRQAQKDLLKRHVTLWLPAIRQKLSPLLPVAFYEQLLCFLDEFCGRELANL